MSDPKPNSRKENVLEQIVNALEGKEIIFNEPISETYQNQWFLKIAEAIKGLGIPSSDMQVHYIKSEDNSNPIQLRNLDSGVYVLYGYFNPCEAVTKLLMAQTPVYASVARSTSKSYIQLFFPMNNTIQYFEITDTSYEDVNDSGWIDSTLTSDFKSYGNDSNNLPQYRKKNGVVYIRGTVSPNVELAGSATAVTIFTLPSGFRPTKGLTKLCQGSGKNTWLLDVKTNGAVTFSRYGTTSNATAGTSVWLPFEISFPV